MSEAGKKKWMIQAAFNRPQSELDEHSGSIRAEITKEIDLACRESDLREDSGYHAARDERAHNETRIPELQGILKHAEVGEATDDDTISSGCVVKAKVGKRKIRSLLGSRVTDEGMDIDVFSPDAPLGATLLGHREDDQVEYLAPAGEKIQIEVLSVSAFEGQASCRDKHVSLL